MARDQAEAEAEGMAKREERCSAEPGRFLPMKEVFSAHDAVERKTKENNSRRSSRSSRRSLRLNSSSSSSVS